MAHADLDDLANALIPFAQQMLAKRGGFLPFGACLTTDGEIKLIAGDLGDEQPPAGQLIELLVDGLAARAQAGELRAAGVCYAATFEPDDGSAIQDIICVSLDHSGGERIDVMLPYSIEAEADTQYGELVAAPGSIAIFD